MCSRALGSWNRRWVANAFTTSCWHLFGVTRPTKSQSAPPSSLARRRRELGFVHLAIERLEVEEDRRDGRRAIAVRGELRSIELGVGDAQPASRRERRHLRSAPLDRMQDRRIPFVEELRGRDVVVVDDERLGTRQQQVGEHRPHREVIEHRDVGATCELLERLRRARPSSGARSGCRPRSRGPGRAAGAALRACGSRPRHRGRASEGTGGSLSCSDPHDGRDRLREDRARAR